ncbi:MAG: baseplate J/gp47 family protein, partial [Stellaceae bacterium]
TEANASLLGRIYARLQKPPKGGAAADYATWAFEATGGAVRGYVYPLRDGTGTVELVLTQYASGLGRKPTQEQINAVTDAIVGTATTAGLRPCTAEGFRVLSPYTTSPARLPGMYMSPSGLTIKLRMIASAQKFAFDWQCGGAPLSVVAYGVSSGPGGTPAITLAAPAPPTLVAAIGSGRQPRLQIFSAGIAAPLPVAVAGITDGNMVLALAAPLTTPPAAGDAIYPFGPLVQPIARAALAYVDGLGPSRQSGCADPLDPWEDVCAIARLEQVALNATDSDGATRLASNVATAATVNGASQDVQAQDGYLGVELLWCSAIIVCD